MSWQLLKTTANNVLPFTRTAVCCLGIASLILSLSANAAEPEELMDNLRWQARVLLVFSAEAGDVRTTQFLKAVDGNRCEIRERDIVVGHIDPAGESFIADQVLDRSAALRIRERLGIGPAEFRVLLVGKDGGVKAEYEQVPELLDVFSLIDGMPMRRRELQKRPTPCSE